MRIHQQRRQQQPPGGPAVPRPAPRPRPGRSSPQGAAPRVPVLAGVARRAAPRPRGRLEAHFECLERQLVAVALLPEELPVYMYQRNVPGIWPTTSRLPGPTTPWRLGPDSGAT